MPWLHHGCLDVTTVLLPTVGPDKIVWQETEWCFRRVVLNTRTRRDHQLGASSISLCFESSNLSAQMPS